MLMFDFLCVSNLLMGGTRWAFLLSFHFQSFSNNRKEEVAVVEKV